MPVLAMRWIKLERVHMAEQLERGAPLDLSGEVALVTGAGRGIGKAIALAVAAAGARVVLTARTESELDAVRSEISADSGHCLSIPADVSNPKAVAGLVKQAEASVGPISVLVNNAGVLQPVGPLWEVDPDEWWRNIEINLRGPFLCTHAVLPGMISRRRGRIANLASGAAKAPIPDGTAYGASKTALVRMTESLARELEGTGVSVFSIDPGQVDTGMHEFLAHSPAWLRRRGTHNPNFTPVERTADLVVRLAAGQADTLSGRLITASTDALDHLVERANEIRDHNRYALSFQRE
jgi:NAD(P)-dependent dehydrogenase (short-subunit alcohol dehydrogenase family)